MVSADRFVVGSDPASCAVVLEDPSIAGRHLGVYVHDGKLAVQDLGAPGGSRVNGEALSGARYIGPREDVVVGVYTIKLKLMSGARGASGPVPVAPGPSKSPAPVAVAPAPLAAAPIAAAPNAAAPIVAAPIAAGGVARAPAPTPVSRAPVAARGHNVMVGQANLEATVPGAPPPPPATDPPLFGGMSTDEDHTVVDARSSRRSSDAGSPAAGPLAANTDQQHAGALAFRPTFDDEYGDEHGDHEEDIPWSLVQRLVRPPEGRSGKSPVIEVIHHRGEHVVDHRVLAEGDRFVLGAGWSKTERIERGLEKPIPLVRLKKGGVAEILQAPGVQGKLLRQGVQAELPAQGQATPLVDGELCSLRIGNERVFVRFAGVPGLLWSKEDLADVKAQRRIQTVSAASALAFFGFFVFLSWVYGYRSKSEDIIDLEDDGFAEIIEKDLAFEEPPKPEKPPEPIKTKEAPPTPEKQPEKAPPAPTVAKAEPVAEPVKEAPKSGLAAALQNIPKVNDSASNQNLNAALSNIKGVRVPGDASGFKTSALTGKGPSSGVAIGGTAGIATSGINSLIRKDGAAGALGGKGDRSVAGKVTTQPRLSQIKGTGELSKDEIQRVINSHVGEIQYCYEKQLRTNSGLAGRVVLEWTVSTAGSVSVVKVATSSLASNDATKCMMDRVKTWKFPKPRGNGAITIVYPFVFNTI